MPKLFKTQDTITSVIHGVTFEIARGNNHAFLDKFRRLSKPRQRDIDKKNVSSKEQDKLVAKAMAGTVLVGWDGWLDEDRKEYPFSIANAEEVLTEDDILRNRITELAGDYEGFLIEEKAELIKK